MKTFTKKILLGVSLSLCVAGAALAQSFPEKSVRIVVPYPPGGFNDTLARISSDKLGKVWSQPVVVENRPGGNTTIGNSYVAKAPADGYTILVTPLPFSAMPGLYGAKLPYDALKDFRALILAGSTQNALVTKKGLNINNAKELVEYAKANPGKLNFGSTGSGSSNHLSMELLMNMTGTKLTHVPYKGSAPAVAALMAGEIDVLFDNVPNVVQQIRAGTINAIGVSGLKRTALLPDTPTVAESGIPGFEVNVWFGMQVPGATPTAIVNQVNKELANIYRQPDVTKRFNDQGVEVIASTPEEFSKLLQSEVVKWTKLIKEANIRID